MLQCRSLHPFLAWVIPGCAFPLLCTVFGGLQVYRNRRPSPCSSMRPAYRGSPPDSVVVAEQKTTVAGSSSLSAPASARSQRKPVAVFIGVARRLTVLFCADICPRPHSLQTSPPASQRRPSSTRMLRSTPSSSWALCVSTATGPSCRSSTTRTSSSPAK